MTTRAGFHPHYPTDEFGGEWFEPNTKKARPHKLVRIAIGGVSGPDFQDRLVVASTQRARDRYRQSWCSDRAIPAQAIDVYAWSKANPHRSPATQEWLGQLSSVGLTFGPYGGQISVTLVLGTPTGVSLPMAPFLTATVLAARELARKGNLYFPDDAQLVRDTLRAHLRTELSTDKSARALMAMAANL